MTISSFSDLSLGIETSEIVTDSKAIQKICFFVINVDTCLAIYISFLSLFTKINDEYNIF